MTTMLMLICLLVGAVLGQRFKVFVLIPAMMMALTAAAVFAWFGTIWQSLFGATVAVFGLQVGYLAGIAIRYFTAAAHYRRMPGSPLSAAPSAHRNAI